jgi:hypothetical protein
MPVTARCAAALTGPERRVGHRRHPAGEPGNGALFGLAVAPGGTGVYFVDADNTLNLLS